MGEDLVALAEVLDAATADLNGVEGIDFLGACAAPALRDFPLLPRPCAACAYTDGTDANRNRITGPLAQECVERSHPFWCHLAEDERGDKTHLCAGWAAGIRERATAIRALSKDQADVIKRDDAFRGKDNG